MPHRSSHDLSPMERRNRSAVRLAFLLWCGGIPPSISGLRLDDGRNGTRTVRVPPLLRRGAGTVPVPGRLFLHAIFLRRRYRFQYLACAGPAAVVAGSFDALFGSGTARIGEGTKRAPALMLCMLVVTSGALTNA
mmetsp:Transcript_17513/g.51092  ORF Transcript_17513/g.51092 Transcript_17513/m.51092 type:complete len:135 (+) Transcript_17513:646-1050(+)